MGDDSGRMPDQVPAGFRFLDDPYGITWRVLNVFRRFHLPTLGRFLVGLVRGVEFERPVLIVGMPRSGTTMLFYFLRSSPDVGSLDREGLDAWRMFHHPRYSGWDSDAVGSGEVKPLERRFVNAFFYTHAGGKRLVEKTANNCLRLPYLLDLFPDARFVVMKRNPCNVINSMINGWHHPEGRFRSYYVPEDLEIPDYPHRRSWCFALIEGWRDYTRAPIPEIAFAQWRAFVRGVAEGRARIPDDQWHELYFENLLQAPTRMGRRLCRRLDLDVNPEMMERLETLVENPVNVLSSREGEKWRHENDREIRDLLPRISAAASELGYSVDPETGECNLAEVQDWSDSD